MSDVLEKIYALLYISSEPYVHLSLKDQCGSQEESREKKHIKGNKKVGNKKANNIDNRKFFVV